VLEHPVKQFFLQWYNKSLKLWKKSWVMCFYDYGKVLQKVVFLANPGLYNSESSKGQIININFQRAASGHFILM